MWNLDQAYIDGAFVPVQGSERLEVVNPATEQAIGTVVLANRDDARRAIAAARQRTGVSSLAAVWVISAASCAAANAARGRSHHPSARAGARLAGVLRIPSLNDPNLTCHFREESRCRT